MGIGSGPGIERRSMVGHDGNNADHGRRRDRGRRNRAYRKASMKGSKEPEIRLLKMQALGSFSWRWPKETESFTRGWVAVADVDGLEVHVRHWIGNRNVFGRRRIHALTWMEGRPTV